MSKALDIANNLSEFDGLAPVLADFTATNITGTNITPTNLNIASTHHTFTVKGIDETVGTDTESGQFSIYNGATKLWGINEDGWVQKPNVPAFRAITQTTTDAIALNSISTYYKVTFSEIIKNDGGHYNSSDTFTAPIDGWYHFDAIVLLRSDTSANRRLMGVFYINDTWETGLQVHGSSDHIDASVFQSNNFYMNAGDFIDFRARSEAYTGDVYAANSLWGSFSGYLIG